MATIKFWGLNFTIATNNLNIFKEKTKKRGVIIKILKIKFNHSRSKTWKIESKNNVLNLRHLSWNDNTIRIVQSPVCMSIYKRFKWFKSN